MQLRRSSRPSRWPQAGCLRGMAVVLVAACGGAGPALGAETPSGPASAHVTYLAGGSVYVDAGRMEGLVEGDTLRAMSDEKVSSLLIARYVSSHRASCDTVRAIAMPKVGDSVRFLARKVAPLAPSLESAAALAPVGKGTAGRGTESTTATAGGAGKGNGEPMRKTHSVRGRVGARYLVVRPGAGGGYSQPALDLRIDGTNLSNTRLDLNVDVRSHRTYASTAAMSEGGEARVYRMSATLHDVTGRRRLTLGRQMSASLSTVSLFDGSLLEYSGERWGVGIFSGAQPDPSRYALSTRVLQHGGYLMRRGRSGAQRWQVSTGMVLSFDSGQVDRQFTFLQGSYFDPRLSLSLAQEMDFNTNWKRTTGDPLVSLTSTFLSARVQVAPALSVDAGYDNRRNVRLYRDHITPETAFDDSYRSGEWLGSTLELWTHWRLSTDGRWSGGGVGGSYRSWSVSTEVYRMPWLQSDLRWRATRFDGSLARGSLQSVGLALRPWGLTRFELSGGRRSSADAAGLSSTHVNWEGADLDLGLARRFYLLLSVERDHGDGLDDQQGNFSLSWMF